MAAPPAPGMTPNAIVGMNCAGLGVDHARAIRMYGPAAIEKVDAIQMQSPVSSRRFADFTERSFIRLMSGH